MVELALELMVPGCPLFTRDTGKDWPGMSMGMGMNGEKWNGFPKGWDTMLGAWVFLGFLLDITKFVELLELSFIELFVRGHYWKF